LRFSKIIIAGAGTAGLACAIQLKRMGLDALILEKGKPGGMLYNANLIENYPGFPGGIPGPDLAERIVSNVKSFNIQIQHDEIQLVTYTPGKFTLMCKSGYYHSETLIIASGTSPVIPETLPGRILNSGLFHFDISQLRSIFGKTIGIIGAGDAAFDYSLTLSEKNNILIFNRSEKIKALKSLSQKVFINNHIKYFENHILMNLEIIDNKVLISFFNSPSEIRNYSLDYLIFATGRKPCDGFFRESLEGNIPNLLKEKRLYLSGDVINGNYRQVSIAVGQGIRAAMEIFRNESN
jgi:thioredoxin reductase (NADPH)